MLFKDVDVESHADVDIYRSSCCRTLFRRSLVTASETAIRVAVTPDREQGFVVVERSCCFVQDKTHLFCKWLFPEKHVKIECTMYLPRQHRARWRLSTGLHLYRSQQAMGPPLTKLNLLVLSNYYPHLFDGCRQVCRLGWPMQEESDKIGPGVKIEICRFK